MTGPAATRYRLDSTWQRPGDGRTVIGGSPLRLFRLSPGGAHVIAQVEAGDPPATAAVTQLLDRFVDAGALHPAPVAGRGLFTADDVTVVMPCYAANPLPPTGVPVVVVVDDASPRPVTLRPGTPPSGPGAGPELRLVTIRHDANRGPGAARNTGLAEVATPLVAFVDTDVTLPDGWLEPLLAHFADPRVALVAPRVASAPGPGPTAGYEERHSPLDLGDEPARVQPGTRVSYVPSAVVLCRAAVVRALGGFDEDLRFGEDVDLVWRLLAAGHRARYEPAVVVLHAPRPDWPSLWRQRRNYGRSAAPLAQRHPGALAPVRMSGWSLAVWLLVAARRPLAAAAVAAGTSAALVRTLRSLPPSTAAHLAAMGHLAAGRQLAEGLRRVWWPLALPALFTRNGRRVVAAAVTVPSLVEAARRRSPRPLADLPAQVAEEVAYGVGVWEGVAAAHCAGPLLPALSGWPRRDDR